MPYSNEGSRMVGPNHYDFRYGGTNTTWGTNKVLDISPVSMQAEPLDGAFAVSELRTTFSDTDGAIWGSLGYGTGCLGSSWDATVYVGGQLTWNVYGPNEVTYDYINGLNSGTFLIHTGRITSVARQNRKVSITSKNSLSQVDNLEWQFPICDFSFEIGNAVGTHRLYGSNFFYEYKFTDISSYNGCYFDTNEGTTQFSLYAHPCGSTSSIRTDYPPQAGRGTLGQFGIYSFLGSSFYINNPRYLFTGSYLGVLSSPITTEAEARLYGYSSKAAADLAVSGGNYTINKTRLSPESSIDLGLFVNGTSLFPQGKLTLGETPAKLWKEMLTGRCVTPLFGTDSIDTNSFATSTLNTAFSFQQQTIDPQGGKVLPYIKNLLEPLRANWSIGSDNTFRMYFFGPRTYADVLGTIGTTEIITSSVSCDEDSKVNRYVLEYGYNYLTGSYANRIERRGSSWGSSNDFVVKSQSKWIHNTNEASLVVDRILARFAKGVPKLNLELPLSRLTADCGSLYAVNDPDSYPVTKVFEVVGWTRDYANSRSVSLDMWDADALYINKGYAKWQGSSSLTNVVNSNSTSGWGTLGTVTNINQAFYGSQFVWF